MKNLKCVIIGNPEAGSKSHLLIDYTTDLDVRYSKPSSQKVIDQVGDQVGNQVGNQVGDELSPPMIALSGNPNLCAWNTSEQEEYTRGHTPQHTDIFLLSFSENTSPSTLLDAKTKWMTEIKKQHTQGYPMFLDGFNQPHCVRSNTSMSCAQIVVSIVGEKEVFRMAQRAKRVGFFECLPLTQTYLERMFREALRAAARDEKPKICLVL